jgi:hypothetical protein
MNFTNTWRWLFIAAALFAAVFFYNHFGRKKVTGPAKLLPGFKAANVASVEILPANQSAISATRSNGEWRLTEPLAYAAHGTNIEALLSALEQAVPDRHFSSKELSNARDTDQKFGFDPPSNTLIFQPEDLHVQIGNATAPGDEVFVKIVGVDGVFVLGADLVKWIPRSANDWRETALADFSKFEFDRLAVTNGGKVLELKRNPTNHLWRMTAPLDARADSEQVDDSLEKLRALRATRFVTDGPKIDWDAYGLQAPDLSLAFKNGTNTPLALAFGKSPTNDATQIFARRNDEQTVASVAKDLLEPWRASYETFRDRHLFSPTGPLSEIEIHARENFSLLFTNRAWLVMPQNFPADTALVTDLLTNFGGLEIAQFVKDAVVPQDLPERGLAVPSYEIILRAATTNADALVTNVPVAEVDFGTNSGNIIFARRTDETSVYGVNTSDFARLPQTALDLRQRRIWNFSENDIARITVEQNGKTLQLVRNGTNQWAFAAGSQGIINDFAIEETAHRLGELEADRWVEQGDQNRARYGFKPGGYRITVELKNGEKRSVEFGGDASIGSPYAMVTIKNQPWIFEFPPVLNQFVQLYLTIPPGAP